MYIFQGALRPYHSRNIGKHGADMGDCGIVQHTQVVATVRQAVEEVQRKKRIVGWTWMLLWKEMYQISGKVSRTDRYLETVRQISRL